MLNKLKYYKSNQAINTISTDQISKVISKECDFEQYHLEKICKGTLSSSAVLKSDNDRLYIKTGINDAEYDTIKKEFFFLDKLYNDRLCRLKLVETGQKSYLVMDGLFECDGIITPHLVSCIIDYYQNRLSLIRTNYLYSLSELCETAAEENQVLKNADFYTDSFSCYCSELINQLEHYFINSYKCLCHGDLSNKNIMVNNKNDYFVIDWEDAFYGIKEYDYLYWLTFYNNRRFYSKQLFEEIALDPEIKRAIIVVILTIKNAISFYSKSYVNNSLGMQQRIEEMISYIS